MASGVDLPGMQVLTSQDGTRQSRAFTCSPDGVIETLYLRRGKAPRTPRARFPALLSGHSEDAVIVAAETFDRLAGEAAEGAPGPTAGPPPGSCGSASPAGRA